MSGHEDHRSLIHMSLQRKLPSDVIGTEAMQNVLERLMKEAVPRLLGAAQVFTKLDLAKISSFKEERCA
ncbi:hypothetical protein AB5N19_11310 [Seiridium cardinale]|uniref:Uncharacterized protein n=1 Tax=Seiridium cardinale TaxID=138064 RepID=A0ABR2XC54_9PEZI